MQREVRDGGIQARLQRLRGGIERWRWTRVKRSPMPARLWAQATDLGRELGAYRVARELGIGYQSLRERLGEASCAEREERRGFVEIDTARLFAPVSPTRAEVELSDASGVKVVIRLGAGESVDIAAVVGAFRATAR